MPLRYEAWTLPWDPGGFYRKVAMLPVILGSGQGSVGFQSFPGDSSVDISLGNFNRLSDLISDTESSLMSVFDCGPSGTQTLIDEWILDRLPSRLDNNKVASLSGPGLLSVFEKILVYAFDYPNSPASQADWLWGSANLAGNPGLEDEVTGSNTRFFLQINATGGTFTIDDDNEISSTFGAPFDGLAASLESEIEDFASTVDVVVVRTSPSPPTYLIEFIDPPFGVDLDVNPQSLTGGTADINVDNLGALSYAPWDIAKALVAGAIGDVEVYEAFEVSSEEAHTGTYSLKIDPSPATPTSNRNLGAQQVITVTPGGLYQASIWIFPTSGTDTLRFTVYTAGEEVIDTSAPNGQTYTANTWTQISLPDLTIPDGVTSVIIRIQNTTPYPTNPSAFYVDDLEFYEGLPPDHAGNILTALLDDAAVDHASDPRGTPLDWVDYSSFGALDSNGNAWNEAEIAFSARWGSNYMHVLDDLMALGYEFELVRKTTPVGSLTHDLHMYNPGGRDDAPVGAGIHTGQPIIGGDAVRRNPSATAVLVAAPDGSYTEDTSAAIANFGRLEAFVQDGEATSTTTRQLLADNFFTFEEENRKAVRFETIEAPGVPRPLVAYRPGDTIPMTLAPTMTREERRVQRIDYVNSEPTQYVVVGSRLLEGEASAFDLIARLWRRFQRPGKVGVAVPLALSGGGSQFGCYLNASAEALSIAVGGEVVTWQNLEHNGAGGWVAPLFPTASMIIPMAGYYNITFAAAWDTWELGGSVLILRNGEVVGPPFVDASIGTFSFSGRARVFKDVAEMVLCAPGDVIEVFIDHGDASAQDLTGAYLNIGLVDRIEDVPGQCIYIFTADGTFDWEAAGKPATLKNVWIFGGGGGGPGNDESTDWKGGGGGAGGMVHLTDYPISGDVSVIVGAGGTGADDGTATNGEDSEFDGNVAPGGGNGGQGTTQASGAGLDGGCGGGGTTAGSVSSGTGGTGSHGGDGGDAPVANNAGGGGGGVSEDGQDGQSGSNGGDGGEGIDLSLIVGPNYGDSGWFGGGGGGWGSSSSGLGGRGGGGDAGSGSAAGQDGIPNSGGGGGAAHGGSGVLGGDGGSGIVIVQVC